MRLAFVLAALLATTTASAQSLAMTDKAGGLPQCEVELDEAYDAVEATIAERDAALKDIAVREVADLIEGVMLLRIRKRPDLLLQEWDQLADETIELMRQYPQLLPTAFDKLVDEAAARIRKRPDLLLQEWDQLADETIETLTSNPLQQDASMEFEVDLSEGGDGLDNLESTSLNENPLAVEDTTQDNPLFGMGELDL